jgi:hypothetical protein
VEGTEQPHHSDYVYAVKDEAAYLEADEKRTPGVRLDPASIVCQFCGKSWQQVRGVFQAKHLIKDPNTSAIAVVWICNECVARMAQTLAEEPAGTPWLLGWQAWSGGGPTRA